MTGETTITPSLTYWAGRETNGWRREPRPKDQIIAGTFTVRITESGAEIHDLRHRFIWSAWHCGRLVGKGHAFKPDEAVARAQELVDPDDIDRMDIDYRGRFLTQT